MPETAPAPAPAPASTVATASASQQQYQVRFDWGRDGAAAIGTGADVVVLVDVLESPSSAALRDDLDRASRDGRGAPVITAGLTNKSAVAAWVLAQQADKGDRFAVAVVAAGEEWPTGAVRFAVEDLLAAGAVIDALADLGIDYCSPEAAAASAAFTGLRNATGHLVGASASGRERTAAGRRSDVDAAIAIDSVTEADVAHAPSA
ncbi:2-phosphosulfolactate phosphatase [Marisediminicola sp. LYQ134]|uniref:2-phosphosulfolactate phosphatase n=1 Tax=Marisediminicola sp. LYQ134 TaxID=3391061 RepID=UPI00398354BA